MMRLLPCFIVCWAFAGPFLGPAVLSGPRADTAYYGEDEKAYSIRTASDLKKHWNTPGFWASPQAESFLRPQPSGASTSRPRRPAYWERPAPGPSAEPYGTQLSYATSDRPDQALPQNQRKVAQQKIVEWVKTYADRYSIARNVVMAMIRNESAFDARAVSRANAIGLMQLVPTAGGREAFSFKKGVRSTPHRSYVFDPERNVELGVIYLHILNTEYFGGVQDDKSRLYAIVSAYNTGPSNVAVAMVGSDDISAAVRKINKMTAPEVFAHLRRKLPARETRTYLRRVVRDMPRYEHLNRVGIVARR